MIQNTPLLFRADFSEKSGLGHFMRTYALAQKWKSLGGRSLLLLDQKSKNIEELCQKSGLELSLLEKKNGSEEEAQSVADFALKNQASLVVLDGYEFGDEYQKILVDKKLKILVFDDVVKFTYRNAALILNQNPYANIEMYPQISREKLLLGMQYVLIREELKKQKKGYSNQISKPLNLLISFGGADVLGMTTKIVEALSELKSLIHFHVVFGPKNSNKELLLKQDDGGKHFSFYLDPPIIESLISKADLAIVATGSTVLECIYLNTPFIGICTSENQSQLATYFENKKMGSIFGDQGAEMLSEIKKKVELFINKPNQLGEMSKSLAGLIDGEGSRRVCDKMLELIQL